MGKLADNRDQLAAFLPEAELGTIERVERITGGLSGAAVYAVSASRGAFVLRVQPAADAATFAHRLLLLRRAAQIAVTPPIVHVDEAARATVTVRVDGLPLAAALTDPSQRDRALASLVDGLRAVHALDSNGISVSDPLGYARNAWQKQRTRPAFPAWAQSLSGTFNELDRALAADKRRVVNHNDVNPMNVIWDGTKSWLLDWDVAGVGHPHYDLATLAMFLRLDEALAFDLCARHDGAPLDEAGRATFRALRQLVALLCGLTFLGLSDDLETLPTATLQEAPALGECYRAMRAGQLDLGGSRGRTTFGLALLAEGLAGERAPARPNA
jgi:aminoglycoside phosphotransferase (APT) family kinase protein